MKGKHLWKKGTALLLTLGMLSTSVPVTTFAEEAAGDGDAASDSIVATALANYDFNDFTVSEDGNSLTDGARTVTLEAEGNGKKPEIISSGRGKVLKLTEQSYANRADALLPGNPFAGQSVDNGFTVNFWTLTTGTAGGGKCLLDFEVAPVITGRAGTLAMNQQMVYWNTTDQNGNFTDFNIGNMQLKQKNWTMVTMAITTKGVTFYKDGAAITHSITGKNVSSEDAIDYEQTIKDMAGTSGIAKPEETNVRIGASLATYWSCAGALVDDVSFYGKALSADEISSLYTETKVDTSSIPLTKVIVSGTSALDKGKTAQLSASYEPVDTTESTSTVKWASDNTDVLTVDSKGKVTAVAAGTANVTATIGSVTSEPYAITVNDTVKALEEGYYLAVYTTTTPFYASASNLSKETKSVYMAVSKDGNDFEVLNNGGGVIFAKKGSGEIVEPRVFKQDDGFVVTAQDATASNGIHIFTSKDGVAYYDDTVVTETELSASALEKANFRFLLDDKDLVETDKNLSVGNAVSITEEEYNHIVNKLGTVVNTGLETLPDVSVKTTDNVTESTLSSLLPSVNATYSDGSTQKFNIDWSRALQGVDLTKEGTYTITGKVNQTKYLNNLKKLNNSKLPEDDPENTGDQADNYDEETQTNYYDATKYVEGMADPCIFWDEQTKYYYMTGSYFPEEGDAIDDDDNTQQYDRVVLRRGRTLEELQDRSKQVTIWKVGNQGYTKQDGGKASKGYRYIWAPEIHRVGNYWVVYFTESESSNVFGINCHALVLDGDQDPYETALEASGDASDWQDYAMRPMANDTQSGKVPFATSFNLDMTYFEDAVNGEAYVIWAGKPYGNSDLFLAKVDKEQPWQLTSHCIRLTTPEYGWEKIRYQVNEGPTVLQKDGKIFMCFSNSGTGSEYSIGMMTADAGSDLLDISNWTKNPYPLLTSRDVDGEEGPGHNSFTVDQDGNAIFVYHARPTSHNYQHCGWDGASGTTYNSEPLNDPCRHARLKRVHWAADGTPILKMTYDEELTENNATVTAKLVVTKGTAVNPGKEDNNGGTNNGGNTTPTPTPSTDNQTVTVTKVTLAKSKLTLGVKEKYTLKATVAPANATSSTVTWKSSKSSVVAVSSAGKITAKKKGTATITATADGKTVSCKVTVKAAPKKVSVKAAKVKLKKGQKKKIVVKLPKNTASNKITFTSSNKKVAKVDANGKITAVKKGKAKITVKTFNGKKTKVTVTVTK